MRRTNLRDAGYFVSTLQEFRASNLHAVEGTSWTGYLPDEWRKPYVYDDAPNIVYTVYSYGTPIAWVVRTFDTWNSTVDRWVIPPVKYSRTTSKHQNIVRRAVAA